MRSLRLTAESFLPRGDSKAIFALVMAAYGAAIAQFISTFLRTFVSRNVGVSSPFAVRHPVLHVCELLILAPLIETLILIGTIELLRKLGAPSLVQALAGAWLLSATHFRPSPLHGIVVPGAILHHGRLLPLLAGEVLVEIGLLSCRPDPLPFESHTGSSLRQLRDAPTLNSPSVFRLPSPAFLAS